MKAKPGSGGADKDIKYSASYNPKTKTARQTLVNTRTGIKTEKWQIDGKKGSYTGPAVKSIPDVIYGKKTKAVAKKKVTAKKK
jgi:hypothetical protein